MTCWILAPTHRLAIRIRAMLPPPGSGSGQYLVGRRHREDYRLTQRIAHQVCRPPRQAG